MRAFWALFCKEDRFLAGPGIAMLVLITVNVCLSTLYNDWSVVEEYIISPLTDSFYYAREYIYALIFLYAVLHERITRSTYQSYMLPTRRWTLLAAKYCAVFAWALPIIPVMLILSFLLKPFLVGRTGPLLSIVKGGVEDIIAILAICGLAMLSYVVAITVRRWRYLAGGATFLAGYLFMERMTMHIEQFILRNRAVEKALYTVFHGFLGRDSAPDLIMALAFCVVSFVIYERTSEV